MIVILLWPSLSVRCAGRQASLSQGHGFESQNEHRQRRNRLKARRREKQARPEKYDSLLAFARRLIVSYFYAFEFCMTRRAVPYLTLQVKLYTSHCSSEDRTAHCGLRLSHRAKLRGQILLTCNLATDLPCFVAA